MKDYKKIYYQLQRLTETELKELYSAYTSQTASTMVKNKNWAAEVTLAMAESDGVDSVTLESLDLYFNGASCRVCAKKCAELPDLNVCPFFIRVLESYGLRWAEVDHKTGDLITKIKWFDTESKLRDYITENKLTIKTNRRYDT